MRLNLDFSSQLVFYGGFLELTLEEDFQSHDVFALLFPGEVNIPEFSLP